MYNVCTSIRYKQTAARDVEAYNNTRDDASQQDHHEHNTNVHYYYNQIRRMQ